MPHFEPAPRFNVQVNTIAGRKVVSIDSEYGTAAISAEGLSADVQWPNLGHAALKLAKSRVARIRKVR